MTFIVPTWSELKGFAQDLECDRVWYCQDCHLVFKESDVNDETCYVECPDCGKHESLILNRNKDDAKKTAKAD